MNTVNKITLASAFALCATWLCFFYQTNKKDVYINNKQNTETLNLFGQVQSIKEESYKAVDKFGVLQKDSLRSKILYYFDKIGNLEKQISEFTYQNETSQFSWTYQYNEDNFQIKSESKNPKTGELNGKYIFIYDKDKNRMEKINYNGLTGEVEDKSIYSDFVNHKPKIEKFYGGVSNGNALILSYQNTYDNYGNCLEMIVFDKSGSKTDVYNYKYDTDNNIIESSKISYENPNYNYTHKSRFDQNKNMIEDIYQPEGEGEIRTTYEYEFDKKGNWTKQIIKGQKNFIVERDIKYY